MPQRTPSPYGKRIAQQFADAAETNDAGKFGRVMQAMAVSDMSRAVRAGSTAARTQLSRGMGLLARVAQEKGADAANALKQALLSGNVTDAMTQLHTIWGANPPISSKDLRGVVSAFKTAGSNAKGEWTAMLDLIAQALGPPPRQSISSPTYSIVSSAVRSTSVKPLMPARQKNAQRSCRL